MNPSCVICRISHEQAKDFSKVRACLENSIIIYLSTHHESVIDYILMVDHAFHILIRI